MSDPKTIEWDAGQDIHGRPVTLRQAKSQGKVTYSIISEPTSQRDEGEKMYSLSRENLNRIAKIEATLK